MATYTDKATGKSYSSFRDLERDVRSRSGTSTAASVSSSTARASDRDIENRDIQVQRSREAASSGGSDGSDSGGTEQTAPDKAFKVGDLVSKFDAGRITEKTYMDAMEALGYSKTEARNLAGLRADLGAGVPSGADVLLAGADAQANDIVTRLSRNEISVAEAIKELKGLTSIGTDEAAKAYLRSKVGNMPGLEAKTPGADTGTPFLNPLFRGLDTTNLPMSELRPAGEAAFGAIQDNFNLSGVAPFLENVLRSRSAASVPQFGLGAALGQFGQPTVSDGRIRLGGEPVQDLIRQNALSNVQSPATSGSYIDFIQQAQKGLGGGNPQADMIREALGITASESAQNAFDPIRTQFINPRIGLLPQGIRSIFNTGVQREFEDLLGGKSSAEVNPGAFLQDLLSRGIVF